MTALIIIAGICASCALCFLFMALTAPEGWEDETGFHFGPQPIDDGER